MFVLVNLKAYPCDPVEVATAAADVADDSGVRVAVAPQAANIESVAETGVETWAQHVSPVEHGSHTGSTLADAVDDAGATGTLLNHSENRMKLADIDASLDAADRADLETVVCANNPEQIAAAAALGPDAAAAVDESVDVYCGAGISTGEDVVAAEELGADGVLLASGVAKADDPQAALEDLVDPL